MDELLDLGSTYCSLSLLDNEGKTFFSKSSSDEWYKIYIESGLYRKCHLMKEAVKQITHHHAPFIFLWDNYFANNEESHYLNKLRDEKNLSHGVAFCTPVDNGHKAILTITGKPSDINFSSNVLRKKTHVYKALMKASLSL